MSTPPRIWRAPSGSESRTTASSAATNGWRFTASVALAGPTRWSERNQKMFVSTSGPSVARTRSVQTSHPRSQSWSRVWDMPLSASSTQAAADHDRADTQGE